MGFSSRYSRRDEEAKQSGRPLRRLGPRYTAWEQNALRGSHLQEQEAELLEDFAGILEAQPERGFDDGGDVGRG